MNILNIQGRKKTGKTTTVVNIISELVKRGYSVGSIKGIHIEGFTMDARDADTGKHKIAGADPVTARCHDETNIMFKGMMDLEKIMAHYDTDWVVIESHADLECPNIITGLTAEYDGCGDDKSLEEQINGNTIACSGIISNEITEFRSLPVINAVTEAERLVDVIEEAYASGGIKTGRRSLNMTPDWNKMWKESSNSDKAEELEFWNNFAPTFRKKTEEPDAYAEKFYEYMETRPNDTLFDMGCGPGTLAIPFAEKGHEVYAADFSPIMLRQLRIDAEEAGVSDRIHTIELNWHEDWSRRELPVCDIAFSSRSLICRDLGDALDKLESVAGRRVCMGVWDIPEQGYDRYIAGAIGYERPGMGAHYMVMGELMDRDVYPELKYIYGKMDRSRYESKEKARERLLSAFTHLTAEQRDMLLRYIDEHLKHYDEEISFHGRMLTEYWQFDHDEINSIAFISWNLKS